MQFGQLQKRIKVLRLCFGWNLKQSIDQAQSAWFLNALLGWMQVKSCPNHLNICMMILKEDEVHEEGWLPIRCQQVQRQHYDTQLRLCFWKQFFFLFEDDEIGLCPRNIIYPIVDFCSFASEPQFAPVNACS